MLFSAGVITELAWQKLMLHIGNETPIDVWNIGTLHFTLHGITDSGLEKARKETKLEIYILGRCVSIYR